MGSQIASELSRLYFDYYAGRLEFADYRYRRGLLLDSLISAPDPLVGSEITQPRPVEKTAPPPAPPPVVVPAPAKQRKQGGKKKLPWRAITLVSVVIAFTAVVFISLELIAPESKISVKTSPPQPQQLEAQSIVEPEDLQSQGDRPEVGQRLVGDFLDRQDWSLDSILDFQDSWNTFPASDRIVAKGAVWFQPMKGSLGNRISEARALAIDPSNDEQLNDLYGLALTLGLTELVPPGWAPRPRAARKASTKTNETSEGVLPREEPQPLSKPDAKASAAASVVRVQSDDPCSKDLLQTRSRGCFDMVDVEQRAPLLRVLPPGEFKIGSALVDDSLPVRKVVIDKPFAISIYEITQGEFEIFCQRSGNSCPDFPSVDPDMPAVNVDWYQANEYAKWLSGITGFTYRLPSEAEWEYATRAGTETEYPFGDELLPNQARYFSSESVDRPLPITDRTTQRNQFGLWHTVGNVREWVAGSWTVGAEASTGGKQSTAQDDVQWRVVRGGSYLSPASELRSSARQKLSADTRDNKTGFRVLREL